MNYSAIHLEECPGCGSLDHTPVYAIPWERTVPVAVCSRCALVFQKEPLSSSELERYYRANSIFHFHGPESRQQKLINARHNFLKNVLPESDAHRTVLDVGCGFGDFLASFDKTQWNRTGIELNAERASFARTELGLTILESPLEDPDIEPGSVDLLCAFGVIEHMFDMRDVFTSIHSCLKMNGLGMLSVADIANPDQGVSDYFCVEHILNFCTQTLESIVRAAGFTVVKTGPLTPPDYKDICCIFRKENSEFVWTGMQSQPELAQQLQEHIAAYTHTRDTYISEIRQRFDRAGLFEPRLRLGIYGAGGHTEQLLDGVPELRNVVHFFDSDPTKHGRAFCNGTINSPEEIASYPLDAVLISSKAFEDEILAALSRMLPESVRIIPMYREFGESV
tara:strand:- start:28248 stop:29429 length:1182 start_codon:yes stop_codon:yes gene_type:complete